MLKGLIFDFDGLILDTEIPRFTAWKTLFNENGFALTYQDWWKTIGSGPSVYDPALHLHQLTQGKVDPVFAGQRVSSISMELVLKQPLLPGVEAFMATAFDNGLIMAVASSSSSEWVNGHLERTKLSKYMKCILTSEDVTNVKPDPELYLLALSRMGLKPTDAIVFEDSPAGVRAAKDAGVYCVAVPNQITQEMDLSSADLIAASFSHLVLNDFLDIFDR